MSEIWIALEPGAWKIGIADGGLVVEQRAQRVLRGAELDAGDVAQARDVAVGAALDDDVAELLFGLQPALRVDRTAAGRCPAALGDAPTTPAAACDVLRADLAHDVGGRQAALGDLLRIEPDAHRVVARAEQLHLADALDARQPVLDVEHA